MMSTKSEKFILERKEYWQNLREIISKINRSGYKSLSISEYQEFPNLYRKTSTDSETAKTLKLSPDTIEYINNLVLQSHNILYSSPKKTFQRFKNFLKYDFPKSFIKNLIPIAIVFFLFFGTCISTFVIIYNNPQYADDILSEEVIYQMKNSYKKDIERNTNANIQMAGFYISNNVSIAFFSFVAGILFGIGTLYLIVYNGVMIGGVAGVVVSSGYGHNFFNFVIAHSSFELLGICLSGGAGLALGLSLIFAKDEKRSVVFARKAKELVPVIIVAGLFITIAAFIEGFISPSKTPLIIKTTIAIDSFIIIILYSYRWLFGKVFRKIKFLKNNANSINKILITVLIIINMGLFIVFVKHTIIKSVSILLFNIILLLSHLNRIRLLFNRKKTKSY